MRHKLIKTDNYLLIVDDSEIRKGDYTYHHVKGIYTAVVDGAYTNQRKIIAHLPLGSPILEGVSLLPPLETDSAWNHGLEEKLAELPYTKHLDDGQYNDGKMAGFEFGAQWGFDKAREKYKFTEEDAKYFFEYGRNFQINADITFTVAREHLSQPKIPTHFEVEMETPADSFTSFVGNIVGQGTLPKKTTNLQSQIVWVGKYIY